MKNVIIKKEVTFKKPFGQPACMKIGYKEEVKKEKKKKSSYLRSPAKTMNCPLGLQNRWLACRFSNVSARITEDWICTLD